MNQPSESPGGRASPKGRLLEAGLRWVSIVSMFALVVLVCALVLIRFFPIMSLGWADEIVELAFAWMVFMGTAAVWRSSEHITIDFIPQALAGTRVGRLLEVVVGLLILGFLIVFTWQGWFFMIQAQGNTSPMLTMPRPLWYAVIPVSGLVMIGYTVSRILRAIRPMSSRVRTDEMA
ncbi:MAG TPA: TRAP transporter small permease [Candidatus Acidoferrum sp.]|nr:TRAP transporter small permease [Candidatus Methylomirabilis sp.]HWU37054.1 TRAP transporter small permease [Candidatus Acidoferrum sp.]